jgi:porin
MLLLLLLAFLLVPARTLNAQSRVAPMLLLQPVFQYYANVGGGTNHAVVVGFRTKVEF